MSTEAHDHSNGRRSEIEAAIIDLSTLHSADEAAIPAMAAIKLTRLTLDEFGHHHDG